MFKSWYYSASVVMKVRLQWLQSMSHSLMFAVGDYSLRERYTKTLVKEAPFSKKKNYKNHVVYAFVLAKNLAMLTLIRLLRETFEFVKYEKLYCSSAFTLFHFMEHTLIEWTNVFHAQFFCQPSMVIYHTFVIQEVCLFFFS